ncbi:uncharacterized protein LAESUDRAFT_658088 [Laetiporus sulphureus 93-53]|uniref:Uncharacterized protein n=1 Tax=Laetiporus sulphureus 93-53 TaxID=1314785 RepID=A0A165D7L1_9APHY|nr:uncharacterized protein LAESUDRAFT_658088 [Laetiporus sulphureus 93-53]KZT04282.1 hypothetical protein LAESUDRAFT_658088 [Laetiporus sulphureus 93-53]
MSSLTITRVEQPSPKLIDDSVNLFVALMKSDPAIESLCGGDVSLAGPMARAMLNAGVLAGEYYAALDENGELAGFTLWMPPGQEMFSTQEQRDLGLTDFMARLPPEGKEYYKDTYLAEFPGFVSSCIGPTGKVDSWWLHMAMVRQERQQQGIARSLIGLVRDKAKEKGETLACSTTTLTNASAVIALGFDLKGERNMPSPWGDWPLYVFALDTKSSD